jgi:hypothetical protein
MIILLVPAILGEARRKCLGDSRTIEDRTRKIAHPLPLGHRCYRAMSGHHAFFQSLVFQLLSETMKSKDSPPDDTAQECPYQSPPIAG